jgi:ribosomal protein S18 acetylase RimI-like enzyme
MAIRFVASMAGSLDHAPARPAIYPPAAMRAIELSDRTRLRAYFRRAPALHIYELGDLDDFFWPHTRWYALEDDGAIHAVALLYAAPELPVVLALGDAAPLGELLAQIQGRLPARFHAHLSPGLAGALAPRYATEPHGECLKMALADRSRLDAAGAADAAGAEDAVRLGPADRGELERFYARAYPGNWFDPRMLETGQFFAIRDGGIVAAGGVHVYAPAERVAALGSIAVDQAHRGRGLGTHVTARICRSLLAEVDHVGLNVRADNRAAIACYERLGFATIGRFEEHLVIDRGAGSGRR